MRTFRGLGYVLLALLAGPGGCAMAPPPPSESAVAALRAYHRTLLADVASGKMPAGQAHDLFYRQLEATQPPSHDLDSLRDLRQQLAGRIAAGQLTSEQGESLLSAGERDLLARWGELAAQEAKDRREMQRLRDDYEEGLWRQKQLEQGEKVFRDRPRL